MELTEREQKILWSILHGAEITVRWGHILTLTTNPIISISPSEFDNFVEKLNEKAKEWEIKIRQ